MPASASHGVSRCLLPKDTRLLWLLGCSIVASAALTVNVTDPQVAWKSVDLSKLEEDTAEAQQQLNKMLAWAIEHSDPEALREQAELLKTQGTDAAQRAKEIQEVLEAMRAEPTEGELMQEALQIIRNATDTPDRKQAALQALRYLVEPIDNANSLQGMGGINILVNAMKESSPAVVAEAAYALGTAASNNVKFQDQLMQAAPGIIRILLQLAEMNVEDVSNRALYVLSALLCNSERAFEDFVVNSGYAVLKRLLAEVTGGGRLRKLLNIVRDTAELHVRRAAEGLWRADLSNELLALLQHVDPDMQERTLLALISLAADPRCRAQLLSANALTRLQRAHEAHQQENVEVEQHLRVLQEDLHDLLMAKPDFGKDEL